MARRLKLRVVIPVIVVGLLAVFAAVGFFSGTGGRQATTQLDRAAGVLGTAASANLSAPSETGSAAAPTQKSTASGDGIAFAVPPASTPSAHYLVRTGDLSILISRGTLLSTVDRVSAMTMGMGGYVMSSAVGSGEPGISGPPEPQPLDAQTVPALDGAQPRTAIGADSYATLTVRVPEQTFDLALKRFATLGDVESISTSSEDVTSQFVDLQARLRHFHAVEQRLVRFLDATSNVNQMLAVQDRIDQVQLTIEQLSAQLKSLRETTTYGTMSVFLSEKGAPRPGAAGSAGTFSGTFWHSVKMIGHG
ncbi:MAG TPA: DUF4349 domain-containing protein, partial [Gemmatimonadaceae bacterium]